MSNLKINMNNLEEVEKSLKSRTLKVCVIGIGRIGLPTALSFAKSGLRTIGVDINEDLVQKINSRIFPLKDEPGYEEIFNDAIKNKMLSLFSENNVDYSVVEFDYKFCKYRNLDLHKLLEGDDCNCTSLTQGENVEKFLPFFLTISSSL